MEWQEARLEEYAGMEGEKAFTWKERVSAKAVSVVTQRRSSHFSRHRPLVFRGSLDPQKQPKEICSDLLPGRETPQHHRGWTRAEEEPSRS